MIPEFPVFKNLELDDKKDIEVFTSKFNPYSDFNFSSLWLWDINKRVMISRLNGNFVVLFNDYICNKPFLSFIGNNLISETTSKLLKFSEDKYKTDFLKLIPEEIARELSKTKFEKISDKDSYDYIYFIPNLAQMDTLWAGSLSKKVRHFVKLYPDYKVVEYLIQEASIDECNELFQRWAKNKKIENCFEINEYKAFQRLFQLKDKNIRMICLYFNQILVGLNVYEILPNSFVMSHFAKSDICYHKSMTHILNWEEAKNLESKGLRHFNWEQDLGILGLRESKNEYRPCFFLEKFIVKLNKKI